MEKLCVDWTVRKDCTVLENERKRSTYPKFLFRRSSDFYHAVCHNKFHVPSSCSCVCSWRHASTTGPSQPFCDPDFSICFKPCTSYAAKHLWRTSISCWV